MFTIYILKLLMREINFKNQNTDTWFSNPLKGHQNKWPPTLVLKGWLRILGHTINQLHSESDHFPGGGDNKASSNKHNYTNLFMHIF